MKWPTVDSGELILGGVYVPATTVKYNIYGGLIQFLGSKLMTPRTLKSDLPFHYLQADIADELVQ